MTKQIINVGSAEQSGDGESIRSAFIKVNYNFDELYQATSGPSGAQGIQGTQGRQGLQGRQGTSGPQGLQGRQGIQGITGTGTQGVQGAQGASGNQGIQGITGTGIQGVQGVSGNQGIQGITGTGIQGVQGTRGLQGTTGQTGLQGINGANGQNGLNGVGDVGPKGDKGDTGNQGVSVILQGTKATIEDLPAQPVDWNTFAGHGWIVVTGDGGVHLDGSLWFWNLSTGEWNDIGKIVGPKGDKGDTGQRGQTGEAGQNGENGSNGTNGTNGNTWNTGNGAPGSAGINANDEYLDVDTGDVYSWDGESWILNGNIKGPKGDTGAGATAVSMAPNSRTGTANTFIISSDQTNQVAITGPATDDYYTTAPRLVIAGRDSYYDSGANEWFGEGGDLYLWAGQGGNGGDLKLDAGQSLGLNGDEGGTVKIRGGQSQTGTGGFVEITAGQGSNANGGPVRITGGYGSVNGGDVTLTAGYGGSSSGKVSIVTQRGQLHFGANLEAPGLPQHFHISKDNEGFDLFLGDDNNYVKLPTLSGVEIKASEDGVGLSKWSFSADGSVIVPGYAPSRTVVNPDTGKYATGFLDNGGYWGGSATKNFPNDTQTYAQIEASIGNLENPVAHIDIGKYTGEFSRWEFSFNGLQFPDNTIQTTAFNLVASATAPTTGILWFNNVEGRVYIRYNDQWVDASPTVLPVPDTNPTLESVTFNDNTKQTTAWSGVVSYNDLTDKPTYIGGGNANTWLNP